MSEPLFSVVLSGTKVGYAPSWSVAEVVVRQVLFARGKTEPRWDGNNTRERGRAFEFSLSNFQRSS